MWQWQMHSHFMQNKLRRHNIDDDEEEEEKAKHDVRPFGDLCLCANSLRMTFCTACHRSIDPMSIYVR